MSRSRRSFSPEFKDELCRGGVSLWFLSSCVNCGRLVKGLVLEHGEQDVTSASSETNEGRVVLLTFRSFAVVVGTTGGVVQRGEGRKEQRSFELAVTRPRWMLTSDRGSGSVGHGCDAGVRG